jgi:hypothetical protein
MLALMVFARMTPGRFHRFHRVATPRNPMGFGSARTQAAI